MTPFYSVSRTWMLVCYKGLTTLTCERLYLIDNEGLVSKTTRVELDTQARIDRVQKIISKYHAQRVGTVIKSDALGIVYYWEQAKHSGGYLMTEKDFRKSLSRVIDATPPAPYNGNQIHEVEEWQT